jgi:tetratricopeptide (TPR) repeat protein
MRRMIFACILLILTSLISGCIFQTENSLPVISQPPPVSTGSFVNSGGSALAIAFKADEISTTSPEAKKLFLKGLTYSTQYARYNESLAFFDAALAIDQDFPEAWVARGVALHNMKRYDEAIKNFDKALAINPNDAGTWSVKAVSLRDWGKPGEAAECNRRASELDPRYGNNPRASVTPVQIQSCDSPLPPVPAGGDVYLGESCLNVSAVVSSGQVISWYKNNRNIGNDTPDERRIVYDSVNFFVNPDDFSGFEGNWYVGTTDKIAFVVKVPILDIDPT